MKPEYVAELLFGVRLVIALFVFMFVLALGHLVYSDHTEGSRKLSSLTEETGSESAKRKELLKQAQASLRSAEENIKKKDDVIQELTVKLAERKSSPAPPVRRLTVQQRERLLAALSQYPKVGGVEFMVFNSGPEVLDFKADIESVFNQLGWKKKQDLVGLVPSPIRGMAIVVKNQVDHPPAANALFVVLREMGFQVADGTDPKLSAEEVRIVISSVN